MMDNGTVAYLALAGWTGVAKARGEPIWRARWVDYIRISEGPRCSLTFNVPKILETLGHEGTDRAIYFFAS